MKALGTSRSCVPTSGQMLTTVDKIGPKHGALSSQLDVHGGVLGVHDLVSALMA